MSSRAARRCLFAVLVACASFSVIQPASASGQVPRATRAPEIQRGIDTYFTYGCQAIGTIKKWAETEVAQFKALGANSIGIGFPLFTTSMTSNDVFAWTSCWEARTYRTPPPWVIAVVVQIAHAAGLKVFLRPLIDQENLAAQNPFNWRGKLRPTNVSLWFAKYFYTLRPYLQMAQREKVQYFAIQTELDSLADLSDWTSLIAKSKLQYSAGDLEVSYSWDTSAEKVLRAHTIFGFDAYPKMPAFGVSATPNQLLSGWNFLLLHRPSYAVPNLPAATISEIGIAALDGAYAHPASGGTPGEQFNQQIQANWFTAACAFMTEHKLQGIYFWGPWLGRDHGSLPTGPDRAHTINIQPVAQRAIKRCFTGT
jgi:hypothetical protein